ncbi:MAG: carbamoyltransferase HypF, partial [Desulfobulbaceae bacterium]|nr:carbamoyltransferase HypF [Desulfobulbaceae bacterium]
MADASTPAVLRVAISVRGNVQGVGFRPFIHRLAARHGLTGSVANSPAGVEILAEGDRQAIDCFCRAITQEKPLPAEIAHIDLRHLPAPQQDRLPTFRIIASAVSGACHIAAPHDMDLCARCQAELLDPRDRRHRYPFISCTDCGPRYTMIRNLPFDRAQPAMASFSPCPDCAKEYNDPADRRFHAQAICCAECGPSYFLADRTGNDIAADPVVAAINALRDGKIVAIKGVGGFHLAVDAANHGAIQTLRQRKHRPDKPLAVMAADLETVQTFALVNDAEAALLTGRDKPILLLAKKTPFPLPDNLAPGNRRVGVMLPYTPLHHLLLAAEHLPALVMTSGNRSGEPICTDNDAAMAGLAEIADLFLLHDREIVTGCDDAVQCSRGGHPLTLRNGRGLAPAALPLAMDCGQTMALGGNDKNTICLTRGSTAFLSQHIGDLGHFETMQRFRHAADQLRALLRVEPDLLVHDLHPDYPTSRYAAEQSELPTIAVQHHHAHAVSCMAEHHLTGPVLALTLDGSGYGPDHTIWGGEILCARLDGFDRLGHLAQTPMPGGEQAIREPWRMAAAFLQGAYGDDLYAHLPPSLHGYRDKELPTLLAMIDKKLNSPLTSSCGRLFDGAAALLGLCSRATFDGQGAMALEAVADPAESGCYTLATQRNENNLLILDTAAIIRDLCADLRMGTAREIIAARFHATIAALFCAACREIGAETRLKQVVCS